MKQKETETLGEKTPEKPKKVEKQNSRKGNSKVKIKLDEKTTRAERNDRGNFKTGSEEGLRVANSNVKKFKQNKQPKVMGTKKNVKLPAKQNVVLPPAHESPELKHKCKYRKSCYEENQQARKGGGRRKIVTSTEEVEDKHPKKEETETQHINEEELTLEQKVICKYKKSCYEAGVPVPSPKVKEVKVKLKDEILPGAPIQAKCTKYNYRRSCNFTLEKKTEELDEEVEEKEIKVVHSQLPAAKCTKFNYRKSCEWGADVAMEASEGEELEIKTHEKEGTKSKCNRWKKSCPEYKEGHKPEKSSTKATVDGNVPVKQKRLCRKKGVESKIE